MINLTFFDSQYPIRLYIILFGNSSLKHKQINKEYVLKKADFFNNKNSLILFLRKEYDFTLRLRILHQYKYLKSYLFLLLQKPLFSFQLKYIHGKKYIYRKMQQLFFIIKGLMIERLLLVNFKNFIQTKRIPTNMIKEI